MNPWSLERIVLDRRREVSRLAELHMRERGWAVQARLSVRLAARLRTLADRLDRPEPRPERKFNVVSGSR